VAPDTLVPAAPRRYRLSIIGNATASAEVVERRTEPGALRETLHPLGVEYPASLYSLSHVALPFPVDDPLYGVAVNGPPPFGIRLGAVAAHGELGALLVGPESFARASWNPFFADLLARIGTP
jgi:hypothetical protein